MHGAEPVALGSTGWADIVAELTRRGFITATALGALSLTTACSASGDSADETRTIDFTYDGFSGQVPAEPKRVVVIEGRGDLEFALVAGYPVIASGFYFGKSNAGLMGELSDYQVDQIEELPFGQTKKPEYEKLAALKPDLVVMRTNAYAQDFYGNEAIARIAPILAVQCGRPQWEQDLSAQAVSLDRKGRADSEVQRYRDLIAATRAELGDRVGRLQIATATALESGGAYVWTNQLANKAIDDLGLPQPHYDSTAVKQYYEVSAEKIDAFRDADVIFVQAYRERPAMSRSTLFQSLKAYRTGQVYDLDSTLNNGLGRAAGGVVKRVRTALLDGK